MSSVPLLRVENLSSYFKQGQQIIKAVDQVSFSLHRGQTLALVGESGSGKSVCALSILRLLPYPTAFHPQGQIFLEGEDLLLLSEPAMRAVRGGGISMIFQEPMTALNPLHTVEKQIGEMISLHRGLRGQELRNEVLSLLDKVKITQPLQKLTAYPHELSGGQRQRVMIAMAIANEPRLLIADEPTTALDVTVQAQVLDLLKELQNTMDMAILLITHDLGVVRKYADRVAVMHQGKMIETQATKALFSKPREAYTAQLLAAEPSGSPISINASDADRTILETRDLQVKFQTQKSFFKRNNQYVHAVRDASLQIAQGTTLGIVGESGSGKTTLALAILRLIASSGEIIFNQQNIQAYSHRKLRALRQSLQVVFQDPFGSLSPRMSVGDIISEGLRVHHKLSKREIHNKVIAALEEVGLAAEVRHRYPHEFSGGQRQRIAIARAVILEPRLIILDEPTSALDRSVQSQVLDLLKKLQQDHSLTYLFISHDLKVVRTISHQLLVMKNGEIIESGPAQEIFNQPKHSYTQALMKAAFY